MGEIALRTAVDLERLHCGNCGIEFAVPDFWLEGRRHGVEGENSFYCPNGHVRIFRENELTRTKKKLEMLERQKQWAEEHAARAEREAAAARGQVTKLRKRIQNGVCPACQRSFQNLKRHMATKHPQLALPER